MYLNLNVEEDLKLLDLILLEAKDPTTEIGKLVSKAGFTDKLLVVRPPPGPLEMQIMNINVVIRDLVMQTNSLRDALMMLHTQLEQQRNQLAKPFSMPSNLYGGSGGGW